MTPPTGTQTDPSHGLADLVAFQPEQLFRAIFEQAAVGIALIETTTGRFLRVNQQCFEIVGLSWDDMTATTFMAITHPDDLQTDLSNMEELKAGRIRNFCMQKRLFRSDGSIVWVDLTVSPLWELGEQPSFHIAVVQDISERKRAEQNLAKLNDMLEQRVAQRTRELEESRQQLQAIVDGTSDAVFVKDLDGRYLLVNRAVEQFVGKRQDEVIGRDDRFIFPPADVQALIEADRRVMAGGVTMTYEDIATTADGVQRTFLSTKGPLFDGQGRVTGLFGISRDITERKKEEDTLRRLNETLEQRVAERTEALRVSEHFRKEVLDSLSTEVAVLDASGLIVAVNRVWEEAARLNDPSGLARVSVGANYLQVCEHAAGKSSEARRTLAGIVEVLAGRTDVFETEYLCAWPGHQQWFSMRVTPLGNRGGCVIAHEDITDRKFSEEALRDSYQRLQVLSREVQVAKEQERSRLSRELHDEFGQVLSGLKFDLIGIASTFAKNRAGSTDVVRTRVMRALGMVDSLFGSLRGMVSALRPPLLDELGLVPALESLVTDIQERSGLCCRVVTDRVNYQTCCGIEVESAIYRIVQELLNNVTRHAKATVATITLSCSEGTAMVIVQDDGCGFRADKVPSKGRFGLRGIRERVELLSGTVDIQSRPGQTTVIACVPLEVPSSSEGAAGRSRLPVSATARKKRRHGYAK
jgi:PAS domain S-box-containing protein